MRRTLGLSILFALAATTAACASDGAAAPPQDPAVLVGRAFVSTAVSGPQIPGGGPLVVEFPDAGRIAATAGCNRSFGSVELGDGVLRADRLGSTLMSCPPPLDRADTWLSDLLASEPRWRLDGDVLTLDGGNVSVSLLDRKVADPDRPVVDTHWVLTELVTADAVSTSRALEDAAPTLTVAGDGTVSGSTGCNRFTGTATVADTVVTFGPLATTRAACPDPELARIESAVLGVLSGEVRYAVEGAAMRLTAADGVTGLGYTAR
ncbi:META domain-containing protein [Rhodococcus sp. 14C212]|uniref:META domain-containing protein n=1 Tax=Rhodococcus sp. 14C212 TaxID=2711209 RepID=UPI0013E9CD36|nr:META domain-containing protein [Rhodococcus sp. 14C212]NGP04088.1 META domain-containing protein [Rhodococcus sp. 14C212]